MDKIRIKQKNDKIERSVELQQKEVNKFEPATNSLDGKLEQQLTKQWSWLDKVSNKDEFETINNLKLRMYSATGENRLKVHNLIMKARLQYIQEGVNANLTKLRAANRTEIASFVLSKMHQLRMDVSFRQDQFFDEMIKKYERLKTLKNFPSLFVRFEEAIYKEESSYLLFLDKLVTKFEAILDQEIDIN